MTPEQKQRIEQIQKKREQQRNRPMLAVEGVAWDDVDFLLSLVKEQEGDDYIRGAYESICGPVRDAATASMRSACAAKVKAKAQFFYSKGFASWASAFNELAHELETLSIEKPKE